MVDAAEGPALRAQSADEAERPEPDERALPAGTTARFALVIVLALVTSAKMVFEFAYAVTAQRSVRCELAAGIDVYSPASDVSVLAARLTQAAAYTHCEARYAPPPSWWLPVGWPLLVLVVAVLAFYADRRWKTRGSRVRELSRYSGEVPGFDIAEEVRQLARRAGAADDVTSKAVVNLDSGTLSATVLGSSRNPVLCLDFGLVAQRLANAADGREDPDFHAVLLHELAHIHYRDVTAARGAMAVWRSFLMMALVPYVIISVILAAHGSVIDGLRGTGLVNERDLTTTLVLVCIGYLARLDVMRNREIYADREARRNGAGKDFWQRKAGGARSRAGRPALAFAGLWRNHPGWDLRARSLTDSRVLFTAQAVPVFLAGAAAAIIDADFQYAVQAYGQGSTWIGSQWMWQVTGAVSAALITLIVGVALWRLVTYGGPAPRAGLWAGLWLGAGMIAGDLAAGQGTINQVLAGRPEMYLLVLAAGAGFCWWTTQCAGAWLARRGDEIPRRAMTAGLAGGFLLLCWWFTWWADAGDPYSTGITFSASGYSQLLRLQFPGQVIHPLVLTVLSWLQFVPSQLALPPAALLTAGAAWAIPLAAWARRPGPGTDGLPSLRAPLAWAAAGTIATWACVIWVQAYLHRTQPSRPMLHGMYEMTYMWLLVAAQAAPAVAVALAVGLRRGRFRLLVTLIATEVTVLAGFAVTFLLVSADGCIRPLATLETSCSWRPGLILWGYSSLVEVVAVATALVAFAVCSLALLLPAQRQGEPESTGPRTATGRVGQGSRSRPLALTALAGAAALGVALAGIVMQFPAQSHYVSAGNQVNAQQDFDLILSGGAPVPPPPGIAAIEMDDWSALGGAALLSRFQEDREKLSALLEADIRGHSYTVSGFGGLERWCADIAAVSRQASGYFLVPDRQASSLWTGFTNMSGEGGRGCESALALLPRDHFSTAFWTAIKRCSTQIGTAYTDSKKLRTLIDAVESERPLASRPLPLLPLPAGARRWPAAYTGNPMNLKVFVQKSFPRSEWNEQEASYAYYGFASAAQEGWNYADGSGDLITVVQYSGTFGATTLFDDDIDYFRSGHALSLLTDPADGGVGAVLPGRNSQGNIATGMVAHVGAYAIEVQVYTPKPGPAAAETLLRRQYDLLEKTGD